VNLIKIKQSIIDQQEESRTITVSQKLIERVSAPLLNEMLTSKLIIVITGIRRSGKSTLALQSISSKKYLYFNFDDEILGSLASEDLNDLLTIGLSIVPDATYLVFDEIQNIEKWELFINRLHRQKYKIIITGSNSHLLSSELSTHLTGRHLTISILPFSFKEVLRYNNFPVPTNITTKMRSKILNQFHYYLNHGGFPELAQHPPGSKLTNLYLKELYSNIIGRDIIQRKKIKNIKTLKEIALLSLSLYSSKFTYQSIKNSCGNNSISTVKTYIDYLQESFIIFVLGPFSYRPKARISLPKKMYAVDVALVNAITGQTTSDLGKKLENLIYLELNRREKEFYYINEPSYEVDFAIKEGRSIVELIQVSWSIAEISTRDREVKALISGSKKYKATKLLIITENEESEIVIDNYKINVIPAWKWLLNDC